jgi:Tol biopolymer transport system component
MNANGTSPARLTHGSAPAEFPAWSPEGTKIAYDSDGHIWIMYADGSQPTRITSKLYSDVIPRWRPTP